MDKKIYEDIYNNLENNSIGNDKRSVNNRHKKKVVLKISLGVLLSSLLIVSISGVNLMKKINYNNQNQTIENTFDYESYGYSRNNIKDYGKLVSKSILEDNGFVDYTINSDNKRHYNCIFFSLN